MHRFQTLFNLTKALRVDLQSLLIIPQHVDRLLGLRLRSGQHVGNVLQTRIVFQQVIKTRRGLRNLRQTRLIGFGKNIHGELRTLDQTLRMRQTAMLTLQLRPLFDRQIEGVHFTHLPFKLLALRSNRGSVGLQRLQMPPQILPTAPGRGHRGKQIPVTTIGVKQLALRHRPHQILVLMLAMDINQIFSGTAQLR